MHPEPLRADAAFHPAPARAPRIVKRKTRITIYLDDEVLAQFRSESERCGKGYQTLINAALRNRVAAQRGESTGAD
jgi:uncharacterized protein (DUF4415 family)